MKNNTYGALIASIFYFASSITSANAADLITREILTTPHRSLEGIESRIANLETRISNVQNGQINSAPAPTFSATPTSTFGNEFNPSIGIVLNGKYADYSATNADIAGFAVGEEGERGQNGLAIDESELQFAANVDDAFSGSATFAVVREDGEDKIELEEAYFQTLPGFGLPNGFSVKAGRAFWTFGYLNEQHSHRHDFADRPLPNRVFLHNAFNDDGIEFTYLLPTDFYTEIGGGLFRGDDFPFGGSDGNGINAWSTFIRIGGDIGNNQSWRLGGYVLTGKAEGGRSSNEDTLNFIGDNHLYATDLRYIWVPTGNPREKEIILQAEFFWNQEDGTYEDMDIATGSVPFDDKTNGWYAQAVYKFTQEWRIGARYSALHTPNVPIGLVGSIIDGNGHDPEAYAFMIDWSNSEFSRLRFQYNHESVNANENDNQFILQYIMSLGAHGAHTY